MSAIIKVMSFNMRMDTPYDGENAFPYRKARILDFLRQENADIIGFQEITDSMRACLVEGLADYYVVGVGREATYSGECSLIAFKKDSMALISCDTVMLSSTPTVAGSRFNGTDQSVCPRCYTKAYLKHKDVAEPFYIYNVHTDHRGQTARILAVAQILTDISSHDKKFFLTGDFNALPDTTEIKMITASARGIKDATASLDGTFHDYGRRTITEKIDYVFTDSAIRILESVRVKDEPGENERYLSDHNPVYITAEL